jgi:plastocyanin
MWVYGGGSGTSANTAGNPVAHMDNTVFIPPAVTIKTGESLTLTADTFVPHYISNGTWDNGTARPAREAGAPEVTELHINGNESAAIGPFTTAGTYQFYCTIHPKMNLAVTAE